MQILNKIRQRLNSQHFGFTLAEVLITLGIIGVVAAMTIPTLVKEYQKTQMVSQLKKTYTCLAQAVKLSEMDNGNNSTWDWGTNGDATSIRQSFDTLWATYLKVSNYCTSNSDCGYSPADMLASIQKDGINQFALTGASSRTPVKLQDGTTIIVFNNSNKQIIADVNGGKGPNIYGKDVFFFVLDTDKGLMPQGYNSSTATINTSCSLSNHGQYCAAKIMIDGWEIRSNYPW